MYIRTSLVCSTLRVSSIRIYILIQSNIQHGVRSGVTMVEIITKEISRATMVEIITKEISRATMVENITIDSTRTTMEEI